MAAAQALYFFIDGGTPKCFYEELPKDTLVVGHYSASEWDDRANQWQEHQGISIYITVDVCKHTHTHISPPFLPSIVLPGESEIWIGGNKLAKPQQQEIFDNNHRVVSQRGTSSGRFTFSAADAGDHKICFMPSSSSGRAGWLSMANYNGGIKLRLDMVIGETNQIESDDKEKLQDITTRVKDLNARLNDIRREQVFQRVS